MLKAAKNMPTSITKDNFSCAIYKSFITVLE